MLGVDVYTYSDQELTLLLCFRFSLVQRTGIACTALAFSLRRQTEFLAALADYSLKCFDTGV